MTLCGGWGGLGLDLGLGCDNRGWILEACAWGLEVLGWRLVVGGWRLKDGG